MYFLSALYTLQYVLIVKMTLVIFIQKTKKKNEPYFGMGEKNTKVMPQDPAIYLFSWEREGILMSPNLT